MSTLQVEQHPQAYKVDFSDSQLIVHLVDGRTIQVPIAWFKSLSNASTEQLREFQIMGNGDGIHWPQLDEDLNLKGLLLGTH